MQIKRKTVKVIEVIFTVFFVRCLIFKNQTCIISNLPADNLHINDLYYYCK